MVPSSISKYLDTLPRGVASYPECMVKGSVLRNVLALLVSPDRLLTGIEKRWGAFRRGSEIHVVNRAKNTAQLQLRYPACLYPPLSTQSMSVAFQAAMEHAGAKQARVEAATSSATETVFTVHW